MLPQEAFRHCKVLGAWGSGAATLAGAGISTDGPGMVIGDSVGKSFSSRLAAMGLHRAWDRGSVVVASAVPPAG